MTQDILQSPVFRDGRTWDRHFYKAEMAHHVSLEVRCWAGAEELTQVREEN